MARCVRLNARSTFLCLLVACIIWVLCMITIPLQSEPADNHSNPGYPTNRSLLLANVTDNASMAGQATQIFTTGKSEIALCPINPIVKDTNVALNLTQMTYNELVHKFHNILRPGGSYTPSTCRTSERLALIIPYRDREQNLHSLLHNIIPFLVRQNLDFTIFVVEQTKDFLFNRCLMFNVGFVESLKRGNYSCFMVHDTDLIPRDNRNFYACADKPRHFVTSRSNEHWSEKLPYQSFIGGVLAVRKIHMEQSNGCSNSYYGWGLEDDDLEIRLKVKGFPVIRYPIEYGGYYSLDHIKQTDNPKRGELVKTIQVRRDKEGLNTLNYTLVDSREKEIFTWLLVKPPPPPTDIYNV